MSLFRHSLLYAIARGIPGLINFLAVVLYTRLLPPGEYGFYAIVLATTALLNAISFRWIGLSLLRLLEAHRNDTRRLFESVLGTFLSTVAVVVSLAALATFHLTDVHLFSIVVAALLVVAQGWFELNQEVARATINPVSWGVMAAVKSALGVSIGVSLAYLGFGANGALIGVLLGLALPGLWAWFGQWREIRPTIADRDTIRALLLYGLPLSATFALEVVISSSDRLLIGALASADAAGLYAVGYDIPRQTLMPCMLVVHLAGFPMAVRLLEREGEKAAGEHLTRLATLVFGIGAPATVGLALLAPNIGHVVVGESFRLSTAALIPLVSVGIFFHGIRAFYLDLAFQLGRRTTAQLRVVLIAAALNLVLNLWWIPGYGILGAAYATIAAYAVASVLSFILGRRVFRLPLPGANMGKIVLATLGMTLALLPTISWTGSGALLFQIVVGVITYSFLIVATNLLGIRYSIASWTRTR